MYLTFLSEDVEVFINSDHIRTIESVGDKLTITTDKGETTYEWVVAVRWEDEPKITYPDVIIESYMNGNR